MKNKVLKIVLLIVLFASACAKSDVEDYIISTELQSTSIKNFLEHEALTQNDMNLKSYELHELWKDTLNYLCDELKNKLPESEFEKLQEEQNNWIVEKEVALQNAGKEVEGGSIYALVINSESTKIIEERVYELYNKYYKTEFKEEV